GREAGVRVSSDPAELDLDWIHEALSERAYWALGRSRGTVEASIAGSLCFGAFRDGRQVGFARVVTDGVTFGWVCDVFVDETARGRGVGKPPHGCDRRRSEAATAPAPDSCDTRCAWAVCPPWLRTTPRT